MSVDNRGRELSDEWLRLRQTVHKSGGNAGIRVATDPVAAQRYGKTVKATPLSNIEYKTRFGRLKRENNMKPPPSCGRIFPGYLVVRKLNTPAQYETWMPDDVFEEIYRTVLT